MRAVLTHQSPTHQSLLAGLAVTREADARAAFEAALARSGWRCRL